MDINKSVNLSATAKLMEDGTEKVVAYFSASIGETKPNYSMNANVTNQALIQLTPENQASYDSQFNSFIAAIRENLV